MKIVHIATEATPFLTTGGLGDVVGNLSKAQAKLGHEVFVVMPRFRQLENRKNDQKWVSEIGFHFNHRFVGAGVYYEEYEGVNYFFLESDEYFNRTNVYGENDDLERFGAFSQMAIETFLTCQIHADVIHLHDWHSAMVAPLIRRGYYWNEQLNKAKIIQTIYDLQYQGVGDPYLLSRFFQFPWQDQEVVQTMMNFGSMNYLKAGINYCDQITTVSQTYAREILTQEYGNCLDGDLRHLSYKLCGIVNGVDVDYYSPKNLWKPYNLKIVTKAKAELKRDLQQQLGLIVNEKIPLYAAVTQLTEQKGWELLAYAAHEIAERGGQFVLLGAGDGHAEYVFTELTRNHTGYVCGYIGNDDVLAQHIYAASDFFLVTSKVEPCGVGQLLAMRYGSIPIVRSTGGLIDTVEPYDFDNETGQGYRFDHYDEAAIRWVLDESLQLYAIPSKFKLLRKAGMKQDLSWNKTAKAYIHLYSTLMK